MKIKTIGMIQSDTEVFEYLFKRPKLLISDSFVFGLMQFRIKEPSD